MNIKLLHCCVGLLLCGAGWAHAQTGTAALETAADLDARTRIHHQRQAIGKALRQAEVACYQRFAVEDCLRQERQSVHKAKARLRQQEAVLDQAQRRERATQRLKVIGARASTQPVPVPAVSPTRDATRSRPEKGQKKPHSDPANRDQQARERARQQQEKRTAHQASQAAAVSSQAAQAAKARQQQEEKNAAAAQHKAQVLQAQADNAAAGRTPAAPLSPRP